LSEPNPLLGVYLERRADLKRLFSQRLGSPDAAEDLLQEMYLKVAAIRAPVPVDNPMAYLFRLGSNLMLDRIKSERRAAVRDGAWRQAHGVDVGGVEIADQPFAEDAVAARQRLAQIVRALSDLPPQTQRIFRLHKLEGLNQAAVASEVGLSRSAVEKHVSAALKHLLARLRP
jgi:RNA polymerase sigma factor (sigma-70 family)